MTQISSPTLMPQSPLSPRDTGMANTLKLSPCARLSESSNRNWRSNQDKLTAISELIHATRGVALRAAPISLAQQSQIARALNAFDNEAHQGPYGVLIHAADIALSRPDLQHSILALNAARNLIIRLLKDVT